MDRLYHIKTPTQNIDKFFFKKKAITTEAFVSQNKCTSICSRNYGFEFEVPRKRD